MSHIMTQNLPGSGHRGFPPGMASSAYTPLEPDDPEIIEEAKVLLAQFIRHPTQGARGSRVTTGVFRNRPDVRTAGSSPAGVNGWQATCVRADDPAPSSSRNHDLPKPSNPRPHLRRSRASAGTGSSAEPSDAPPASSKRAMSTTSTRRTRPSPSLSAREYSSGNDMAQAAGIRRSRRSRTGPSNYYQIPALDLVSDDTNDSPRSPPSKIAPRRRRRREKSPLVYGVDRPLRTGSNVRCAGELMVYSSPDVQIFKSPFTADQHLNCLPYSPGRNVSHFVKGLSHLQTDRIVHVDFDTHEMKALLGLLSFYGVQSAVPNDITLADHIIQILSNPRLPSSLSKKVSRLCRLSRAMTGDDAADLMRILERVTKDKPSQKARRLLFKALGREVERPEEIRSPNGQLLPEIAEKVHILSRSLQHASGLRKRDKADIDSFIADARKGNVPSTPYMFKVVKSESEGPSPTYKSTENPTLSKLLRQREIGGNVVRDIQSNMAKDFKLVKTWKGASNDVIVLAWSPEGTRFAAGATAQCDEHNMEYNRGNNLVWGDLTTNVLTELPDHYIPRPPRRNSVSNAVSDARLFMSVSSMEWHQDALFTASYDNTVKLWDFSDSTGARCFKTLRHDSKVEVMARSNLESNVLATGARSFGLWHIQQSTFMPLELIQRTQKELVPTSLAWGMHPRTRNMLLAGMSEKEDGVPKNGLLAAWEIAEATVIPQQFVPGAQNIFDIKWHATLPLFITASSAPYGGARTFKDTRSVVRLYSPAAKMMKIEFECPALDINDVTTCPTSSTYVTASCTDGVTYVWDTRRPDDILHRLRHGAPLNQIDEETAREEADVGVRVAVWGMGTDQFYTGASDGVLKLWDITRAPEDALVKDVAHVQEEIMSGAFSPDKSNLLIGDAAGGLHVFSPGTFTPTPDDNVSFNFKRADVPTEIEEPDIESGIAIAREYFSSGKLVRHPRFGFGKGPNYNGPFAAWARPKDTPAHVLAATPLQERYQMEQLDGPLPAYRWGLDAEGKAGLERRILLSEIRNQRADENKRKREPETQSSSWFDSDFVDLCSDDEPEDVKPPIPKAPYIPSAVGAIEVIDLTGDTDLEDDAKAGGTRASETAGRFDLDELWSSLEEDFWWPDSKTVDANLQNED
ncbi:WD40-repeat-containing domain protein [Aspergillus ambiguus]|uniref:WD repeat protein n=1 Tax=Aspergillus ambiguus TaxID=176160 RepID=UPI003CCD0F34